MSTVQGNLINHNGDKVAPNTLTAAVYDAAKQQALSQTLVNTPDKGVLGFPSFVTTLPFARGTVVYHLNKLWKFNTNHSTGDWDAAEVDEYTIKDLVDDLAAAYESGEKVPKLADNLASWDERGALPTEDKWSGAVRTAGGDMSIISAQGAELASIKANAGSFKATALRTTGFNILHNAVAVGTGYYFLVPKLPFGTFGTANEPNGVLFTDNENANLKPTVYFKPLASGVPTTITDGTACAYTDSNGYRFYNTTGAGYIIVSGITYANTCAHIGWSRRYDEFISPTAESDAGSSVALSSVIASIHADGYMLGVEKQGKVIADAIERISATQVKWYRNCDKVKPTWTTTQNEDESYTHTATISSMKADGAASMGNIALTINGQTISYTDNSTTASDAYVIFELATAANGTANLATHLGIEDWGLEVLDGVEGSAEITMQYYMGYPDALAAIAQIKMKEVVQTVADTDADLNTEIALNDDLGDAKAKSMSVGTMPMVCGRPMVLYGAGVPAEATVPANWDRETMGAWTGIPCHIGQLYINTSAASGGLYYAINTSAVGGWKQA